MAMNLDDALCFIFAVGEWATDESPDKQIAAWVDAEEEYARAEGEHVDIYEHLEALWNMREAKINGNL